MLRALRVSSWIVPVQAEELLKEIKALPIGGVVGQFEYGVCNEFYIPKSQGVWLIPPAHAGGTDLITRVDAI